MKTSLITMNKASYLMYGLKSSININTNDYNLETFIYTCPLA